MSDVPHAISICFVVCPPLYVHAYRGSTLEGWCRVGEVGATGCTRSAPRLFQGFWGVYPFQKVGRGGGGAGGFPPPCPIHDPDHVVGEGGGAQPRRIASPSPSEGWELDCLGTSVSVITSAMRPNSRARSTLLKISHHQTSHRYTHDVVCKCLLRRKVVTSPSRYDQKCFLGFLRHTWSISGHLAPSLCGLFQHLFVYYFSKRPWSHQGFDLRHCV